MNKAKARLMSDLDDQFGDLPDGAFFALTEQDYGIDAEDWIEYWEATMPRLILVARKEKQNNSTLQGSKG